MKKIIILLILILAVGGGAGVYYANRAKPKPEVTTLAITRGDIADVVAATGTLEAVETVDIGTQVSGVVQELHADFNSIVKKGQVIARLDPSIIQTQIEQQKANVTRAEADLDRLRVSLADAKQKLERARELAEKKLIARTELEAAELAVKTAESQIRSSEAGLSQAKSQLNTQEVNLGHTVITAPIDGIVISRSVDQGQTVAASMSTPTLYILAADLTKMQVLANIDEADVGRMRPGQHVTFRVDAYPTDVFTGTVSQVRLQPATVQNVVTYQTVIAVPNPEMKLMPGMTASVSIEVARRNNVLRVPAAAARFRPTADMFAALNLPVPEDLNRVAGRGGNRGGFGRRDGNAQAGGAQPQPGSAEAQGGDGPSGQAASGGRSGGQNLTPEERQKRMQERMAAMTPEERARFQERMRSRGQGTPGAQNARTGGRSAVASGATTIDALFAPLPVVERRERVWLWVNNELKRVDIRTGVSDGTWTELIDGSGLESGTELVTNIRTGLEATPGAGQGNAGGNPLMGPQRGGRGRGR